MNQRGTKASMHQVLSGGSRATPKAGQEHEHSATENFVPNREPIKANQQRVLKCRNDILMSNTTTHKASLQPVVEKSRQQATHAAWRQCEVSGPLDLGPAQERRVEDLGLEAQHRLAALAHVAELLDRVRHVLQAGKGLERLSRLKANSELCTDYF